MLDWTYKDFSVFANRCVHNNHTSGIYQEKAWNECALCDFAYHQINLLVLLYFLTACSSVASSDTS